LDNKGHAIDQSQDTYKMSCDSKINLLHYGQNVGIKHPDLILIRGIVERDHVMITKKVSINL
jgi:hypothetical protein